MARSSSAVFLFFLLVATCRAQVGAGAVKTPELVKEHFDRMEVFAGKAKTPMKMVPVLYWNNKTRGPENPMGKNVTALWIDNGRPEAVTCLWPPMPTETLTHELCSLSRSKTIHANFDNRRFWNTKPPGLKFKPIPGAPKPGATATMRQSQMKLLARRFQVDVTPGDRTERLRLLPQPLYRYETLKGSEVLDGTVFAFCSGVDPDAILLLEAVESKSGRRWEFAFARRSTFDSVATYEPKNKDRVEVWSVERISFSATRSADPFRVFSVTR